MPLDKVRPAQKAVWSVDLTSYYTIAKAGGTLVGTPTVDRSGLYLDGSTQYATFPVWNVFDRSAATVVMEFTPTFGLAGAVRMFFDTDGDEWSVYNDAADQMSPTAYGSLLYAIASATWLPLWKTNQRNVLVLTSDVTTLHRTFLNGVQIGTSAAALTNTRGVMTLALGATTGGANISFPGVIHSFTVHDGLWTNQEVLDHYNHATFNFVNRADVWLDMKTSTQIPQTNSGELLIDGDMEAVGTAAWAGGNAAVLTKETTTPHSGAQCLRVAYNGTANPYVGQVFVTVGKIYRFRGWCRSDGVALPAIFDNLTVVWTGTNSTSWQYFDIIRLAVTTGLRFVTTTAIAGYTEWDDVSVIESGQLLDDGAMEMTGTTEWTALWSAILSKSTVSPRYGTQALRVTKDVAGAKAARQTILTTGRTYRAQGWGRGDGTSNPSLGGAATNYWVGTNSTTWQYFNVVFVATDTYTYFYANSGGAGNWVEFDDVLIREVQARTLDRSGKGRNFMLGDGRTTSLFPTLLPAGGFIFDGSNDYIIRNYGDVYNNASQSIVCCFCPDFYPSLNLYKAIFDSAGSRYTVIKSSGGAVAVLEIYLGNTLIANVAYATYAPYWKVGGKNVVVVVGTTGNTSVYLNYVPILTASATAWAPATPTNIRIGIAYNNTAVFDGTIYHFSTYAFMLTPTQIRDITATLLQD